MRLAPLQKNQNQIITNIIQKSDHGLYGRNKKKVKFENFKDGIDLAISQSLNFNGNLKPKDLFDNLGCTLGQLMETIKND